MSNKESFEKWCARMNQQYLNGMEGTEGFQRWFSNLIENHVKLNKAYTEYSPSRNRPGEYYKPCQFILKTIEEELYTEEEWKEQIGPKRSYPRKDFNWQAIKNYWIVNRMPVVIPMNDCPAYWINILSALHKKYGIFASLDDLNRSLMHTGNVSDPIPRRGLYVRDIRDLCIAYAIFHGLSFEKARSLIDDAQQKLSEAQDRLLERISGPNETITQQVFDAFEPLIIDTGKKIPAFLSQIEQDCGFFPKPTDLLHWSAFGEIYKRVTLVTHPGDSKTRDAILNELDDLLGTRIDFTSILLREIDKVFQILNDDEISAQSELCIYLKHLLDSETIMNTSGDGVDVSRVEDALEYVRRMYILAIMKAIKENKKGQYSTVLSAQEAIKTINDELIEAGSRDIQYYYKSNEDLDKNSKNDSDKNSKNEIIAKGDVFDWFVVEAMKREEDIREEEDLVTGYDTVLDFMQSGGN